MIIPRRSTHGLSSCVMPPFIRVFQPGSIDWWRGYGVDLEILPEPVLKLYSTYVDTHPVIHNMNESNIFEGLCPMYFLTEKEIPWTWRWALEAGWDDVHLPYLKRRYHVKWWNDKPVEDKVSQIQEIIEERGDIRLILDLRASSRESTAQRNYSRENINKSLQKKLCKSVSSIWSSNSLTLLNPQTLCPQSLIQYSKMLSIRMTILTLKLFGKQLWAITHWHQLTWKQRKRSTSHLVEITAHDKSGALAMLIHQHA